MVSVMKLNEEQMAIIDKAEIYSGYEASTTQETHWLNEEEAYYLIQYLVETIEDMRDDLW